MMPLILTREAGEVASKASRKGQGMAHAEQASPLHHDCAIATLPRRLLLKYGGRKAAYAPAPASGGRKEKP